MITAEVQLSDSMYRKAEAKFQQQINLLYRDNPSGSLIMAAELWDQGMIAVREGDELLLPKTGKLYWDYKEEVENVDDGLARVGVDLHDIEGIRMRGNLLVVSSLPEFVAVTSEVSIAAAGLVQRMDWFRGFDEQRLLNGNPDELIRLLGWLILETDVVDRHNIINYLSRRASEYRLLAEMYAEIGREAASYKEKGDRGEPRRREYIFSEVFPASEVIGRPEVDCLIPVDDGLAEVKCEELRISTYIEAADDSTMESPLALRVEVTPEGSEWSDMLYSLTYKEWQDIFAFPELRFSIFRNGGVWTMEVSAVQDLPTDPSPHEFKTEVGSVFRSIAYIENNSAMVGEEIEKFMRYQVETRRRKLSLMSRVGNLIGVMGSREMRGRGNLYELASTLSLPSLVDTIGVTESTHLEEFFEGVLKGIGKGELDIAVLNNVEDYVNKLTAAILGVEENPKNAPILKGLLEGYLRTTIADSTQLERINNYLVYPLKGLLMMHYAMKEVRNHYGSLGRYSNVLTAKKKLRGVITRRAGSLNSSVAFMTVIANSLMVYLSDGKDHMIVAKGVRPDRLHSLKDGFSLDLRIQGTMAQVNATVAELGGRRGVTVNHVYMQSKEARRRQKVLDRSQEIASRINWGDVHYARNMRRAMGDFD